MSSRKVSVDQLASAVNDVLSEYTDELAIVVKDRIVRPGAVPQDALRRKLGARSKFSVKGGCGL